MNPWPWVVGTGCALVGVLVCESTGRLRGRWVLKPLASVGFLGAALALGALGTRYGQWVLAGLVLSFVGDVVLLGRARWALLGGIAAFALAHVAYGVAMVIDSVEGWGVMASLLPLALVGGLVVRQLWPHVPGPLRGAVIGYVVVISVMVSLAAGSVAGGRGSIRLFAATLFFFSDLSVARDRFLDAGLGNRLWGLPAYYVAQILFAWSVVAH